MSKLNHLDSKDGEKRERPLHTVCYGIAGRSTCPIRGTAQLSPSQTSMNPFASVGPAHLS